jgi:hypothetical protein
VFATRISPIEAFLFKFQRFSDSRGYLQRPARGVWESGEFSFNPNENSYGLSLFWLQMKCILVGLGCDSPNSPNSPVPPVARSFPVPHAPGDGAVYHPGTSDAVLFITIPPPFA